MHDNWLIRSEWLLGKAAMQKISISHVAVFGAGGVGSFCIEALARMGIGKITVIDGKNVSPSNLNRQLIAMLNTVGMPKTAVVRERVAAINSYTEVECRQFFYNEETSHMIDFTKFSYIVDAIDTVTSKKLIIKRANDIGANIISCMGAGNKLDPTQFKVSDIYQTSVCPLARVMRRELRKMGIAKLKVVYSTEPPLQPDNDMRLPGSVSFVPAAAGLALAAEVVKDLINA